MTPERRTIIRGSISSCGPYRYRLTRYWGPGKFMPFIMLNPSVADAEIDDPTIRRCMGFARREGAGGIVVGNIYAFRATKPEVLWKAADPFGPDNDEALAHIAIGAVADDMPIVCAWGAAAQVSNVVTAKLFSHGARCVCLGKTKEGRPRHPLYVHSQQALEPFP